MRLSAIVPVLNESFFMPLYLESVSAFADEILIVDGGSTDGTLETIERFRGMGKCDIRVFSMPQTGQPYTEAWNEHAVRNFLIEQATGDWIINLDADEMFDDRIREMLPELMSNEHADAYRFPFICFWGDIGTVRVNAPGDEHWSVDILRMFRHHIGIRYNDMKHHCTLLLEDGRSIWHLPPRRVDVPAYHYHYGLGSRIKYNDSRRNDVNIINNGDVPDWQYGKLPYEIRTVSFAGEHPFVVRNYLRSRAPSSDT
ncbi:glycosyltransferase [Paenibacillus sp. MBLB4367]|uniref:glycosyltransferase n=1 Tax=Paenibacillus sp. MBLB4367 TaxID=3384767 RepID=UPI00390843AB